MVVSSSANLTAQDSPTEKPAKKRPPVSIIVAKEKPHSATHRQLEVQLKIEPGFEIYSQHSHEFTNPLKVQVLDGQLRPINAKIQYPKGKVIKFDKAFGGDYQILNSACCDISRTR